MIINTKLWAKRHPLVNFVRSDRRLASHTPVNVNPTCFSSLAASSFVRLRQAGGSKLLQLSIARNCKLLNTTAFPIVPDVTMIHFCPTLPLRVTDPREPLVPQFASRNELALSGAALTIRGGKPTPWRNPIQTGFGRPGLPVVPTPADTYTFSTAPLVQGVGVSTGCGIMAGEFQHDFTPNPWDENATKSEVAKLRLVRYTTIYYQSQTYSQAYAFKPYICAAGAYGYSLGGWDRWGGRLQSGLLPARAILPRVERTYRMTTDGDLWAAGNHGVISVGYADHGVSGIAVARASTDTEWPGLGLTAVTTSGIADDISSFTFRQEWILPMTVSGVVILDNLSVRSRNTNAQALSQLWMTGNGRQARFARYETYELSYESSNGNFGPEVTPLLLIPNEYNWSGISYDASILPITNSFNTRLGYGLWDPGINVTDGSNPLNEAVLNGCAYPTFDLYAADLATQSPFQTGILGDYITMDHFPAVPGAWTGNVT